MNHEEFRSWLEKHHASIKDVAKGLDVSPRTVERWYYGELPLKQRDVMALKYFLTTT